MDRVPLLGLKRSLSPSVQRSNHPPPLPRSNTPPQAPYEALSPHIADHHRVKTKKKQLHKLLTKKIIREASTGIPGDLSDKVDSGSKEDNTPPISSGHSLVDEMPDEHHGDHSLPGTRIQHGDRVPPDSNIKNFHLVTDHRQDNPEIGINPQRTSKREIKDENRSCYLRGSKSLHCFLGSTVESSPSKGLLRALIACTGDGETLDDRRRRYRAVLCL